MVLISIHPFAFRKIFLAIVALLGLSSALCFADPVFMTKQYSPARDQLRPARSTTAAQGIGPEQSLMWRSFVAVREPNEPLRQWNLLMGENSAYLTNSTLAEAAVFLCGTAESLGYTD